LLEEAFSHQSDLQQQQQQQAPFFDSQQRLFPILLTADFQYLAQRHYYDEGRGAPRTRLGKRETHSISNEGMRVVGQD